MNDVFIARKVVSDAERLSFFPKHCGSQYLYLERAVFEAARFLSKDYKGGYWEFYECSNGAFYVAPSTDKEVFDVSVAGNYFEGSLSSDAFGIVACLFALSHLANVSEGLVDKYHALVDYAKEHNEWKFIARAID